MQFESTVLQSLQVLTSFEETQHQNFDLAAILMLFILLMLDLDFQYLVFLMVLLAILLEVLLLQVVLILNQMHPFLNFFFYKYF